jgi:hypothetical protein
MRNKAPIPSTSAIEPPIPALPLPSYLTCEEIGVNAEFSRDAVSQLVERRESAHS